MFSDRVCIRLACWPSVLPDRVFRACVLAECVLRLCRFPGGECVGQVHCSSALAKCAPRSSVSRVRLFRESPYQACVLVECSFFSCLHECVSHECPQELLHQTCVLACAFADRLYQGCVLARCVCRSSSLSHPSVDLGEYAHPSYNDES